VVLIALAIYAAIGMNMDGVCIGGDACLAGCWRSKHCSAALAIRLDGLITQLHAYPIAICVFVLLVRG
jgi:hypothetical protein